MQKVAVVTGSAKGLGKTIALSLAGCGYTIVIHYRKSQKLASEVLSAVKKRSPKSMVVKADLTSEPDVKKMFDEIFGTLGRVDFLVNNVGGFLYKKFSQMETREFKDLIESNVYSTLFCSRAVLPAMRKQKSGHIINIGVVSAERLNLLTKSAPYFYAKNGIYMLTKMMAHEEARYGIHVNMISPASLKTDIFKPADFPMQRPTSYDDVMKALLFLISDAAYYINGSNIEVAGGFIPGIKS